MKKIICVIVLLCSFHFSFAQTEDDYTKFVETIINYINTKDAKSIHGLFSSELQSNLAITTLEKNIENYHSELGSIHSSEFMIEGERGFCYLLEFDNASMVLIIKLTPEKKLTEFTFEEY